MVRKYQQGGQLSDTQQQGLQYLAQMYAQQTGKDPQQDQEGFMQFVQQLAQQAGVQDIGQLLDMIYQQAQGQAQAAKHGAKLNYLKKLTDKCPEGTELMYFKAGGRVCSQCKEKIDKEACGKKIKKNCGGKKMFQKGEKIVKDQEPAEPLGLKNPISQKMYNVIPPTIRKYMPESLKPKPYNLGFLPGVEIYGNYNLEPEQQVVSDIKNLGSERTKAKEQVNARNQEERRLAGEYWDKISDSQNVGDLVGNTAQMLYHGWNGYIAPENDPTLNTGIAPTPGFRRPRIPKKVTFDKGFGKTLRELLFPKRNKPYPFENENILNVSAKPSLGNNPNHSAQISVTSENPWQRSTYNLNKQGTWKSFRIEKQQKGGTVKNQEPVPLFSIFHPELMYSDVKRNGVIQRKWRDGPYTYIPDDLTLAEYKLSQDQLKTAFFQNTRNPMWLPNIQVTKGKSGETEVIMPNYRPFSKGTNF